MEELNILVSRLGWPSTSTRWWTMQLLSARLCKSATKPETESALLRRLCSSKFEAEVVEILYIFWMASHECNYSLAKEVLESIPKPSPLSCLLIEKLVGNFPQNDVILKLVSDDFRIPADFDGVQGVDLPQIFRTTMSQLETYSNLPFVKQMAFEWAENAVVCPESPYQGDLAYFMDSLSDSFTGLFSTRTSLRAISAYLKTLSVAKQIWRMPPDLVIEKALMALPVHPTLAFLKPNRPVWFPEKTDFDGDQESIEMSLLAMLARVEDTSPGDELIAFNSPIMMSIGRCIEVSLVRWSQDKGGENANLEAHLNSVWNQGLTLPCSYEEPLNIKTLIVPPTFQQLKDFDCKAWPLAGTMDFNRIGYLQHDLYPSRLFIPTLPGLFQAEIIPRGGQLEIEVDAQVIAEFSYWNAAWGPTRHKSFGGNCGTALISRGKKYREGGDCKEKPIRQFYSWRVRKLQRENSYDEFNETVSTGTLFV